MDGSRLVKTIITRLRQSAIGITMLHKNDKLQINKLISVNEEAKNKESCFSIGMRIPRRYIQ